MGLILLVLLVSLLLSAAVLIYVAYPYRGEETPVTPELGRVLRRGVAFLPTLDRAHGRRGEQDEAPDLMPR